MSAAPAPAAKHKPPIPDGKLWKAARSITLRDGTVYAVRQVVFVDSYNVVILVDGADDLILVPKHAVNSALLHRERFVKAENT